jgi:uncharacterized membrane protein YjgN (DUF898 family)
MTSADKSTVVTIGYRAEPGLAQLVFANLVLSVFTLGIYRFWAKTRIRRYFWGNIDIDGEPLEYTGTGRELFVGFLIVIIVLAPISLLYSWLQRLALGNSLAQGIFSLIYFLAMGGLIQAAIFRARRYRLSRTTWRGIVAGQGGSTWRYLGIAFLYAASTLVSMGLLWPWASVALERYKINNTYFGNSRFSIGASGRPLFLQWLVTWLLCVVPVVIALAATWHTTSANPLPQALMLLLVPLLLGIPALISFRLATFRYLVSRTRLDKIRFRSRASGWAVIAQALIYGAVMGGFLVALITASVFAFKSIGTPFGSVAGFHFPPSLIVILGLFCLVFTIGSQVASYCLLKAPIIRHVVSSLKFKDLEAVQAITQSERKRQRFGEGLADSFEIAGL